MEGLWNEIAELQYKVNILEEVLDHHRIPLPYEKPVVPLPSDDEEDWLPF